MSRCRLQPRLARVTDLRRALQNTLGRRRPQIRRETRQPGRDSDQESDAGPTGQGHYAGKPLPTEWSTTKNVAWKQEIPGKGWSSPVVQDGRIVVQEDNVDTVLLLLNNGRLRSPVNQETFDALVKKKVD